MCFFLCSVYLIASCLKNGTHSKSCKTKSNSDLELLGSKCFFQESTIPMKYFFIPIYMGVILIYQDAFHEL